MAIEAEKLQVRLDSSGGSKVTSSLSAVGSAARGVRGAVEEMGDALRSATGRMTSTAAAAMPLRSSLDSTEEEFHDVGNAASAASAQLGMYSASASSAAGTTSVLTTATKVSAIPALVSLSGVVATLIPQFGALTAGALSLAGAFGGVIGTGVLAWGQKMAQQNLKRAESVAKEINRLEALQETEKGLTETQEDQLKTLRNKHNALMDQTTIMGALAAKMKGLGAEIQKVAAGFGTDFIPLVEDAVDALPKLVARILEAMGPLDAFAAELRSLGESAMDVIPAIVASSMDLARMALPAWQSFTKYIATATPSALSQLADAFYDTSFAWYELAVVVKNFLPTFLEFGVTATNVIVPALTDTVVALDDAFKWFNNLEPAMQKLGIRASLIAPALFGVSAAAVALSSGLSTMASAIIGPTGVILALAALPSAAAAAGGALNDWENDIVSVRQETSELRSVLVNELLATLSTLQATLGPIVADIGSMFLGMASDANLSAKNVASAFNDTLVPVIKSASLAIQSALTTLSSWYWTHRNEVQAAVTSLSATIEATYGSIPTSVGGALSMVETMWETHRAALIAKISTLGSTVLSHLETALYTVLPTLADKALAAATAAWDEHRTAILAAVSTIAATVLSKLKTALYNALPTLADKALAAATAAWDEHRAAILGTVSALATAVLSKLKTALYNALPPQVKSALGTMAAAWNAHRADVINAVETAVTGTIAAYKSLKSVLVPIVTSAMGLVESAVASVTTVFNKHRNTIVPAAKAIGIAIKTHYQNTVTAALELVDLVLTKAEAAWKAHKGTIQNVGTAVDNIMSKYGDTLTKVGLAAGTAALALKKLGIPLSKITGFATGAAGSFKNVRGALLGVTKVAGPAGIAISGILAYADNFKGFADAVDNVASVFATELVKSAKTARAELGPIIADIASIFSKHFPQIEVDIAGLIDTIELNLVNAIRTAGDITRSELKEMGTEWNSHKADVKSAINDAILYVKTRLKNGLATVKTTVSKNLSILESEWDEHGSLIKEPIKDAMAYVEKEPVKALTQLLTLINPKLGLILLAFETNFKEIKKTVNTALSTTKSNVKTLMGAIENQIINPLNNSESETSKTLASIQKEFSQTWKMIRDIVDKFVGIILKHTQKYLVDLKSLWKTHLEGEDGILHNAKTAFNALWWNVIKPILDIIQTGWEIFGDDLTTFFDGVMGTLLTVLKIGMDAFLTAFNVVLDIASGDWEGAWTNIKKFLKRTWKEIKDWTRTSGRKLFVGAVGYVISGIKAAFKGLYNWLIGDSLVKDIFRDIASFITGAGRTWVDKAIGLLTGSIEHAFEVVKDAIIGPGGIIPKALDGVVQAAKDTIDHLKNLFENVDFDVDWPDPPSWVGGGGGGSSGGGGGGGGGSSGGSISDTDSGGGSTDASRYSVGDFSDIGSFATGGHVTSPGLAMLHAGEDIVPSAEVQSETQADHGGGGDVTIENIVINAPEGNADVIRKSLSQELRSRGFNS